MNSATPRKRKTEYIMNHEHQLSPSELEGLYAIDTPTICNVIELFNVRPRDQGYMDGRIKACIPLSRPMIGYAVTATFRSSSPPSAGHTVYDGLLKQVEAFQTVPSPPVIVFQDLDEPSIGATFGEVMCSVYKTFGAAGLVTSGEARDLDQIEQLGFPIFAAGTNPSHAWCQIVDVNIPIEVGGLTVRPGDLLHGDRNGVTSIPNDIAARVARASNEFLKTEELLFQYLRSPNPTVDGYKQANADSKSILRELIAKIESNSL
jgi:4-hydroxy-4-methyl-2-oxoglutarate aldolase